MKRDEVNSQVMAAADLAALSAAAQGRGSQGGSAPARAAEAAPEDPSRTAKIASLKAKFKAGTLLVDERALASKLVDVHLNQVR